MSRYHVYLWKSCRSVAATLMGVVEADTAEAAIQAVMVDYQCHYVNHASVFPADDVEAPVVNSSRVRCAAVPRFRGKR